MTSLYWIGPQDNTIRRHITGHRNQGTDVRCVSTPQQDNSNSVTNHYRTVYPKKYAHGFVVLCFVVVMQSFIMNSHEVFIHIHQGCFAGTGAIVRLPQCQWSKPDGYGKISQCMTTTKHSKAKTVCIFLGIYFTTYKICLVSLLLFGLFISSGAGDRIFRLWWSIPCLIMPWLLKSPEHQQTWHWICRTENMYCCSRVKVI